jgi:hypothetical protein
MSLRRERAVTELGVCPQISQISIQMERPVVVEKGTSQAVPGSYSS